ncbi:MAG TPA: YbhB/YbcL family Raf kinase inhibitor-like protein [Stellaceae bacterium]
MRGSGTRAITALAVSAVLAGTAQAAVLEVTSSAFKESGMIAAKYAGHLVTKRGASAPTDCGGENVSPPLAWKNVPAGTKSFGLVIYDPDGAKGGGAVHWLAYGIAGDRRGLPEGFGNKTDGYVGGSGAAGNRDYMGPCPIPGHTNHYIFSLYALDLAPDALQPGMTRDQFLETVKGHVLDIGSIVARAPSRQRSP